MSSLEKALSERDLRPVLTLVAVLLLLAATRAVSRWMRNHEESGAAGT